jgi:hypothetical protein
MMKILVEDKPKTCSECLFCKPARLDATCFKKIYQCELLNVEIMNPSRVRITDCPLKERSYKYEL